MPLKKTFARSALYFKNIYAIVLAAIFTALAVIIAMVKIPVLPPISYIYLTFIFTGAIGLLFGPVIGLATGAIVDVAGFFIAPNGSYFFGFTLTAMFVGFVYGLLLFRFRRRTRTAGFVVAVVAAQFICDAVGHLVLNSLWLSMMYGSHAWWYYAGTGLVKNAILWPIESVVLILFLGLIDTVAEKAGAYKRLGA